MDKKIIGHYENGNIRREVYCFNDKYHREDGPAIIHYYKNGNIKYKTYFINGEIYRKNGPAAIYYREDGSISYEHYYNYINNHCIKKYIDYRKDKSIKRETHFLDGLWHREDGPAYIEYDNYGVVICKRYGNKNNIQL